VASRKSRARAFDHDRSDTILSRNVMERRSQLLDQLA
jgi:hypothetical protein